MLESPPMCKKIQHGIETFIEWSGHAVSWLTLIMVLVTTVIVILRYVFDTGWIALQESVSFMHATVFLIGMAYTLKQDGHVRVDIIYQRLSTRGKAIVELLGHVLIVIPVMVFLMMTSWEYVADSWAIHETSSQTGGLPGVYLLKSLILVMAGLLILQAIANTIKAWYSIMEPAN